MQFISATEGCRFCLRPHAVFACHAMFLQGTELHPHPSVVYQQVSQHRWGPSVWMPSGPDLLKHLNACLRDWLNRMLHSLLAPSTYLLFPWQFGPVNTLGCSCHWKLGLLPSPWHPEVRQTHHHCHCYFLVGGELVVLVLIPAGRRMLWCVCPHWPILSSTQPCRVWFPTPLVCCPLPTLYLLVALISRRRLPIPSALLQCCHPLLRAISHCRSSMGLCHLLAAVTKEMEKDFSWVVILIFALTLLRLGGLSLQRTVRNEVSKPLQIWWF